MTGSDLTFVIPAYNAERTVARAVESAARCRPERIVVIDDGSRDRTAEVAERAGAVVTSQPNAGAARARRAGLEQVRTGLICFLDADDAVHPPGLGAMLRRCGPSDERAVIGGRIRIFRPDGTLGRKLRRVVPGGRVTTEHLLAAGGGPWAPCAAVWTSRFARLIYAEHLGPLLEPRLAEDYEMLLRASMIGRIELSSATVGLHTVAGGKSETSGQQAAESVERIRTHYAALTGIPVRPATEAERERRVLRRTLRGQLAQGNVPGVTRALGQVLDHEVRTLVTRP